MIGFLRGAKWLEVSLNFTIVRMTPLATILAVILCDGDNYHAAAMTPDRSRTAACRAHLRSALGVSPFVRGAI